MSNVTNIMLTFSSSEFTEERVKELSGFKVNGHAFEISSIDDKRLPEKWYGGTKFFEWNVFIGAYNHLDLEGLLKYIKLNVNWDYPEYVQLFVLGQNDLSFQVIYPFAKDN